LKPRIDDEPKPGISKMLKQPAMLLKNFWYFSVWSPLCQLVS